MLKKGGIDRIVVLMQGGPLPNYMRQHGYSKKPDNTRAIVKHYFPEIEIFESAFPWWELDFSAPLYNEGFALMQDCDVVFRLDPDMFFHEQEWIDFVNFVRETDHDFYCMDFSKQSVNYYMTGDYEHGLKDAKEFDPLCVSPKKDFKGLLNYKFDNGVLYAPKDVVFHHFRGWNKPKSTGPDWIDSEYAKNAFSLYSNNGEWYKCPEDIRNIVEDWTKELKDVWQKES